MQPGDYDVRLLLAFCGGDAAAFGALRIPRGEEALYLLQQVRDEAHRFAVGHHRRLRGRRMVSSVLDAVPGGGPARKKALLRRFGSMARIREAGVEELAGVVPAGVAAAACSAPPPPRAAGGDAHEEGVGT